MKVLVAEDDAGTRLLVCRAVEKAGHECVTAVDGDDAWDKFDAERPDVVVTDRVMPRVDGLELCRRVRSHPAGGPTYIIVVTSMLDRHEADAGIAAGADDYLGKPIDLHELEVRLVVAARVSALHRQVAAHQAELERLNDDIARVARTDALTGLNNRLRLDEDLGALEGRVARYGHRYAVALLDLDNFKAYNDRYGHLAGDDVLKQVAAAVVHQIRQGDAVYRYGGEELLCVFPEQGVDQAAVAAGRMTAAVRRLSIEHAGNQPAGVVTLSAGVAALAGREARAAAVIADADAALYRAKFAGRDRVEVASGRQEACDGSSEGSSGLLSR